MAVKKTARRWLYATVPTLVLMLLAFYPQLSFWASKGSEWQGAYFVSNFDEVAYSAYVQALINGKPRKYDPYLATETPDESFYSIQFVPAYAIALPARWLGLSSSTAFILLTVLSAVFAGLFIFWFLYLVTGNELLSAVGVVLICCLGTAVAYQGELRLWIKGDLVVEYLPFLRRYQPGFAFPFFFAFCAAVWHSLGARSWRRAVIYSALSGVLFALLVFSYFFLWTAAAAWLACIYVFHLIWSRDGRTNLFINLAIVCGCGIAALIPYFILIGRRSPRIDTVQLLANTHLPVLGSPSIAVGIVVIFAIAVSIFRGRLALNSLRTLFALAFAATPLVLFNQQLITGRSLQPIHYEVFIANYIVLTAAVLFLSHVFERGPAGERIARARLAMFLLAFAAAFWGAFEAYGSTNRGAEFANLRDISIPAIRFIESLEREKPSGTGPAVVLATNSGTSDLIPTIAPLRPLWGSHTSSVGGTDIAENKRLFHCFLFFAGFTEKDIAEALRSNAFEMTAAIFGADRALPSLGQPQEPVSAEEIEAEVVEFEDFAKNLTRDSASRPVLSYVIVPTDFEPNWANLDKWYERDSGTATGLLKVYNVTLRP